MNPDVSEKDITEQDIKNVNQFLKDRFDIDEMTSFLGAEPGDGETVIGFVADIEGRDTIQLDILSVDSNAFKIEVWEGNLFREEIEIER